MSDQTYINKPIEFHGVLTKQPILLSDSKGRGLEEHASLIENFGYHIEFQYKGGARLLESFCWLKRNLTAKVKQYGHIVLYIYLGTCDLTEIKYQNVKIGDRYKRVRYCDLRYQKDSVAVDYIKQQLRKFRCFISRFPTVQLVFLEIPCYSLEQYNRYLRCPNPESFHQNDVILTERIGILKDYIRHVNLEAGFNTPRFKSDLIRYRKRKGKKPRASLNFSGFKDGLHPDTNLAGTWMRKIVGHMLDVCR